VASTVGSRMGAIGDLGARLVETSEHCGRLAGCLRVLLEAHEDQREIPEVFARAALDMFDEWRERDQKSTGAVRLVGVTGADGPREEQVT
jgi:hypothetical protein